MLAAMLKAPAVAPAQGLSPQLTCRPVFRVLGPRSHLQVHAEEKESAPKMPDLNVDAPKAEEVKEKAADVQDAAEEAADDAADKLEDVKEEAGKAAKKGKLMSHRLDEALGTEELFEELKDKEEFGKRGEIIVAVQLVICALAVFPPMQLQGLLYLMGAVGMVIGTVLCLWSIISLGKSFSPLVKPRKNHKLVTTGMYQYMRHPLYAGILLLAFGLASVSCSESRLLLAVLLYAILNYKAKQEESALKERYGGEYEEYMDKVNRFIPVL